MPMAPPPPPGILIGASAGGIEPLTRLARDLPSDLPAAVVVVVHLPASTRSVLPEILDRVGALPARAAADAQPLRAGTISVAPPDHHLEVADGHLRLTRGPKENGLRPAIDVLFRTAAEALTERAAGVLLSGALDDGTTGLREIKRRGGYAIVQEPEEAVSPSMPLLAVRRVAVDGVLRSGDMAATLIGLANRMSQHARSGPRSAGNGDLGATGGASAAQGAAGATDELARGRPTPLTCPECGGMLSEQTNGDVVRYECHVGHGFAEDSLLEAQGADLERALYTAMRTLQERIAFLEGLAARQREAGNAYSARLFEDRAGEAREHVRTIEAVVAQPGLDLELGSGAGPTAAPAGDG